MEKKNVVPQNMIYEAYKKIKNMIFQQKLAPGQRLVGSDLSKMLNMSQTPIINALNRLEQVGYVASEPNRGFYLKPYEIQEVWDGFDIREALEVHAVQQAIHLSEGSDFDMLHDQLIEHEQYNDYSFKRKKFLLDARFHLKIASMMKNRPFQYLLKINFEHLYLRANLEHYDAKRLTESSAEHHKLIQAIKKKDIISSVELMRKHIHTERGYMIQCLSKDPMEENSYL